MLWTGARPCLLFVSVAGTSCAPSPVEDEPFDTPLPILVLDTDRVEIDEEDAEQREWVSVDIQVWEPSDGGMVSWTATPTFLGQGGIRVRGNSSRDYDKKQYRLETRTATGKDLDVSWLGLPGVSTSPSSSRATSTRRRSRAGMCSGEIGSRTSLWGC